MVPQPFRGDECPKLFESNRANGKAAFWDICYIHTVYYCFLTHTEFRLSGGHFPTKRTCSFGAGCGGASLELW